jgi:hypothetical protein
MTRRQSDRKIRRDGQRRMGQPKPNTTSASSLQIPQPKERKR